MSRVPDAPPGLAVEGLTVAFGERTAVRDVSFTLAPGECLAVVGESGSGKSVTARTLLGLSGGTVEASRLTLDGDDLTALDERGWRRVRGARIGLVLQDALVSLDPLRPVGREIDDALRLHTDLGPAGRRARVLETLREVGLPEPEQRRRQRSTELSGGLRQRALLASALALRPGVVVADEPTTALDAEVRRLVVDRLAALRDAGTAVLVVTHDLGVVRRLADRVVVLHAGRVVEQGPTDEVLAAPRAGQTRRLVAALPAGRPRGTRLSLDSPAPVTGPPAPSSPPHPSPPVAPPAGGTPTTGATLAPVVLRASGLHRRYGARTAVADVSLEVRAGETLGVVGASGSGKTTTARLLLGLETPDAGTVELDGLPWSPLPERRRRPRRHLVGTVPQDAAASFDPRWTVGALLVDALTAGRRTRSRTLRPAVVDLLARVGLTADVVDRPTDVLSGGQRQRVALARALAGRPRALVLDEPVSALDLTVQAQVLDLLDDLQRADDLALVLVSHDLDVVEHASDRVVVVHEGRVVETGPTVDVFAAPRHAHTRALLAART